MDLSQIDLNSLPVFIRVVEHGSISGAARALGFPKSSVSRTIARLEEDLGVRLLERTSRHMRMTQEGEAFRNHCERVMAELKRAESSLSQMRAAPQGRLGVAMSFGFGNEVLSDGLVRFAARYPQIDLRLHLSNEVTNLFQEDIDLAVRIGELKDSSLRVQRLGQSRRIWVASPTYLARHDRPKRLEDVIPHLQVALRTQSGIHSMRVQGPEGERTLKVGDVRISVNDNASVRNMIIAGMGISLLPNLLCGPAIRDGRLIQLLPEYTSSPICISAVYPAHNIRSPKVRAFVNFLVEQISQSNDL